MKYAQVTSSGTSIRRRHVPSAGRVRERLLHAWRKRPPSPRDRNGRFTGDQAAHERTRQTYGPERLQSSLPTTEFASVFTASSPDSSRTGPALQAEATIPRHDGLEARYR